MPRGVPLVLALTALFAAPQAAPAQATDPTRPRLVVVTAPDLRLGGMESLPVESESVDVVLANMALHHAPQPVVALTEMKRVIRPGGRLVLTDLARHELEWTREELADEWPGFSQEELAGLLGQAGLTEINVRPMGTCNLARPGTRDASTVEVLLATASAG